MVEATASACRTGASRLDDACVVVPMYNEAAMIGRVVAGLREYFNHIVCVDDASADDSAALARAAGATVVQHPINLGQGGALQTGFTYALRCTPATVVVTFDADGQHLPADAARLAVAVVEGEADVVLGSRFLKPSDCTTLRVARKALLKLAVHFTTATTGLKLTDSHNGLRALSRTAVGQIDLRLRGMAHASELLTQIAQLGLTYQELPVTVLYSEYSRSKGQSSLNALNILADMASDKLFAHR